MAGSAGHALVYIVRRFWRSSIRTRS
jgi:hypothetical protein